jgi:hypothetical protein
MKKKGVDLLNGLVWIPDSKTASGVAEVPLTDVAVEAFRKQISLSGAGPYLFPNPDNPAGYQASFKKVWATTLRKARVPYFRIYDLRSTYAARLSAARGRQSGLAERARGAEGGGSQGDSSMKRGPGSRTEWGPPLGGRGPWGLTGFNYLRPAFLGPASDADLNGSAGRMSTMQIWRAVVENPRGRLCLVVSALERSYFSGFGCWPKI